MPWHQRTATFFWGSLCPPSRPVSCQALRTQWRQFWPTKGETFPHLKKGQPRSDSAEGLSSCHFGCPFSLFCLCLAPTALVSANVQALLYSIPKECGMTRTFEDALQHLGATACLCHQLFLTSNCCLLNFPWEQKYYCIQPSTRWIGRVQLR